MAVAQRPKHPPISRTGAPDAGKLFEEHSDRLFAYCLRFLGSRADAEDAVQTTFLYAHRALERGVAPESEYVWLHSIAKNVCRWQRRTIARRGTLSTAVDLDTIPGKTRGHADDERELLARLPEALASMPEAQRRAILLREWQGLPSSEIASQLGMSPAATYALLTRARRSLARALTTTTRQPLLGLNLGSLVFKLKALFTSGTAKVVATGLAVGSVTVGGVAVERSVDDRRPSTRPASAFDANGSQGERLNVASSFLGVPTTVSSVTTRTRGSVPQGGADRPEGGTTPGVVVRPEGGTIPGVVVPEPTPSAPEATDPTPTIPAEDGPSPPAVAESPAPPVPDDLIDLPAVLEDPVELPVLPDLELPVAPSDLVPPALLELEQPLDGVSTELPGLPPLLPVLPPLPKLPVP